MSGHSRTRHLDRLNRPRGAACDSPCVSETSSSDPSRKEQPPEATPPFSAHPASLGDLRSPLTEAERRLLIDSCQRSGVPLKVTDPEFLARAAALLPCSPQSPNARKAVS